MAETTSSPSTQDHSITQLQNIRGFDRGDLCTGVHINNISFHLQCLDPNADPTGFFSSYKVLLDRPISVKYALSAMDDDDHSLRTICFAHYIERLFYSDVRTRIVQQFEYLYRSDDDVYVNLFVNKPDILPGEMFPISTARALHREFANIYHQQYDPTMHIWLRYRGFREGLTPEPLKKVLLHSFRVRRDQQPREVYTKLYSYCNDLLLFTADNFDETTQVCAINPAPAYRMHAHR